MSFLSIYSLDKLRVEFKLDKENLQSLYDRYSIDVRIEYWGSSMINLFKHNFKFKCADDNSFWIGCEPNYEYVGLRDWVSCVIEFNPNKLKNDPTFLEVYKSFMIVSREIRCCRFDLAIDIDVERSLCVLLKDKRKFSEIRYSDSNLTQYLGSKSSHGRVKLYNKAFELGLVDSDLTRLELTIDYSKRNEIDCIFPSVFVGGEIPNNVSGTDKALVFGALLSMDILNFLDKRKKKKIKDILADTSLILNYEPRKYLAVLSEVEYYINKTIYLKSM